MYSPGQTRLKGDKPRERGLLPRATNISQGPAPENTAFPSPLPGGLLGRQPPLWPSGVSGPGPASGGINRCGRPGRGNKSDDGCGGQGGLRARPGPRRRGGSRIVSGGRGRRRATGPRPGAAVFSLGHPLCRPRPRLSAVLAVLCGPPAVLFGPFSAVAASLSLSGPVPRS